MRPLLLSLLAFLALARPAVSAETRFDLVCRNPLQPTAEVQRLSVDLARRTWCRAGHCKPYRRWKIARVAQSKIVLRETSESIIVYDRTSGAYHQWADRGRKTVRRWQCEEAASTAGR